MQQTHTFCFIDLSIHRSIYLSSICESNKKTFEPYSNPYSRRRVNDIKIFEYTVCKLASRVGFFQRTTLVRCLSPEMSGELKCNLSLRGFLKTPLRLKEQINMINQRQYNHFKTHVNISHLSNRKVTPQEICPYHRFLRFASQP